MRAGSAMTPLAGVLASAASRHGDPIDAYEPGLELSPWARAGSTSSVWNATGMRLLLNVIWFVLAGVWLAIGYAFAALIMFILIITIPFGVAALRIGVFALWPFGKTVVRRGDAGAGSAIGNVIWFLLAGWWLIIGHLVTGVLLCLTIIGIPLGLANFKLIPVTLRPFGRDIVSIEEAERQGFEQQVTVWANAPRSELRGGTGEM
jgi:uncharacterized membrane protein YccF (DUF307 family)